MNLSVGNILDVSRLNLGVPYEKANVCWTSFINNAWIPSEEGFEGTLYAGYIAEKKEWCLPSWIWTNAAIVRAFCETDKMDISIKLADKLTSYQQKCGGWIVRNDYDSQGAIPMLAPNDSAYIANNAFVELYLATNERRYLDVAIKCADWIIETARPDGLVYVGYNMRDMKWDKNCVIVDVGFTAGLFARLVEITNDERYRNFLERFVDCYISLFYMPQQKGFCTSIDKNDRQQGGMFGRGQAWALEGLIPAYKVLKDSRIKQIVEDTVNNLIRVQLKNGGWAYNLSHPLMGEDCKAVSVIAKNIMEWYLIVRDERIRNCAAKALAWCLYHTASDGVRKGGIFSFCLEGGIVKDLYTSCAFVYSSAYAIELNRMLNNE